MPVSKDYISTGFSHATMHRLSSELGIFNM